MVVGGVAANYWAAPCPGQMQSPSSTTLLQIGCVAVGPSSRRGGGNMDWTKLEPKVRPKLWYKLWVSILRSKLCAKLRSNIDANFGDFGDKGPTCGQTLGRSLGSFSKDSSPLPWLYRVSHSKTYIFVLPCKLNVQASGGGGGGGQYKQMREWGGRRCRRLLRSMTPRNCVRSRTIARNTAVRRGFVVFLSCSHAPPLMVCNQFQGTVTVQLPIQSHSVLQPQGYWVQPKKKGEAHNCTKSTQKTFICWPRHYSFDSWWVPTVMREEG